MPSGDNAVIQKENSVGSKRETQWASKRDVWGQCVPFKRPQVLSLLFCLLLRLSLELSYSPAQVVLTFSCIWNHLGSFKNIGAWAWTTETAMKLVHLGHRQSTGNFQNCPRDSNMWPRWKSSAPAIGSEGEDVY